MSILHVKKQINGKYEFLRYNIKLLSVMIRSQRIKFTDNTCDRNDGNFSEVVVGIKRFISLPIRDLVIALTLCRFPKEKEFERNVPCLYLLALSQYYKHLTRNERHGHSQKSSHSWFQITLNNMLKMCFLHEQSKTSSNLSFANLVLRAFVVEKYHLYISDASPLYAAAQKNTFIQVPNINSI